MFHPKKKPLVRTDIQQLKVTRNWLSNIKKKSSVIERDGN
jgi:hypothetical protein